MSFQNQTMHISTARKLGITTALPFISGIRPDAFDPPKKYTCPSIYKKSKLTTQTQEKVAEAVTKAAGLQPNEFFKRSREYRLLHARKVFCYILHDIYNVSYLRVAHAVSRDSESVRSSLHHVRRNMDEFDYLISKTRSILGV